MLRRLMFETILIAGQGEVATRVEQTCKRMGLDLGSNDTISGTPFRPDVESVLKAAKACGAEAVHPGYVAASAGATLAAAVREAGLIFVGASESALKAMGDKLAMRAAATRCGLRVIPGSDEAVTDARSAHAHADRIGYPICVKPVAGTAGIGIYVADDEDELEGAIGVAARDAEEAFGDGRVYLERSLRRPRHVEITVVGDSKGTYSVFGERECSLQRKHQVLVAEAPSPLLLFAPNGDAAREALIESARELAQEIGLVGVATFEFLYDCNEEFFFLEANADMRGATLVTEMLTRLDPIEMALSIAAGEAAPDEPRLRSSGHAFEARLCAEDPARGFAPVAGKLTSMRFPPAPQGKARSEPALEVGDTVPTKGEPLLARVATRSPTRHQALMALDRTLAETTIPDLTTNLEFLRRALNHDAFRAGQYDTSFASLLLHGPRA